MQIFKLSAIAALALQLSLQAYGAESTPNSLTLFVPLGPSSSTSKSPTIEVIGESIQSQ
jgi:hypothetical protein